MASIFDLINNYQTSIIASITIALGSVQAGVSSWAIHRIIMDEHFLIYIIGHVMSKKTKNLREALSNYASVKEFLRNDLFSILDIIKIAFSIALVAGVCQILFSLLMLYFRKKPCIRKLWFSSGLMSTLVLATSFGLLVNYWVPNVLYFQIFLACTGVNFFVMFHLVASMIPDAFCTGESQRDANKSGDVEEVGTLTIPPESSSHHANNAETQTQSISRTIQEEFPLPIPLPPPIAER